MTRSSLRLVVLVLASASPALAQGTTISIVADTPIASMSTTGTNVVLDGVPAGTPISGWPNSLSLTGSQTQVRFLSTGANCYPTQPYQSGIGVNFAQRAGIRGLTTDAAGSSPSASAAGATHGPTAILCTFQNAPGTIGRVELSFRARAGTTGTTSCALDIDNDGVVELQTATSAFQQFPYTIGASGTFDVRVAGECHMTGTGNGEYEYCYAEISVSFRPDINATCTFSNYGQGCGPTSTGTEVVLGQTRVITLVAANCFPNAPVISFMGGQQLNLPLPGNCALLCSVDAAAIVSANAAGIATQSISVPVTSTGRLFHQFLPVMTSGNNLVITTSDGVQIDCVR